MPYYVDVPRPEQAYLDGLPISPQARERIEKYIAERIANVSDEFRRDPANRPKPGSDIFLVQHIIWDRWGDGRMLRLDFHVSDENAQFGVLLLVFVDCH